MGDSGPGFVDPDAVTAPLTSTKPGGTGVGLFVVRTVAANHGGTVAVGRSALGGAEVRCRFPRGLVCNRADDEGLNVRAQPRPEDAS